MIEAMNEFMTKVKNETGGCVIKILRIKNGFSKVKTWGSDINKYKYCDIKMNVIISNNSSSLDNYKQCMIGEIQFLLKWTLKAKKIGHKYYSIKRRREFVDSVSYMIERDCDYIIYTNKIKTLIETNNFDSIATHLLLKPNIIVSMLNIESVGNVTVMVPFLYQLARECANKKTPMKMFDLFYGSLLHLENNVLDEKCQIMKKTLNFETEATTYQYRFVKCKW